MASLSNGPNAAKYATAAMQKAVETIAISVIQQLPDDSREEWVRLIPAITALHFGRKAAAPRKSKKKIEAKSDDDEKEVGYASGSEVKVDKVAKKREEDSEDEAKPVKAKGVKKYEESEDEAKPVKAKVAKRNAETSEDEKPVKDKRKRVEDEKKKSTYGGSDSD